MSPVLVSEDVIREFMESCKKGEKKAQIFNWLLKTTTPAVSNLTKSCPSLSTGQQSYDYDARGSSFRLPVGLA